MWLAIALEYISFQRDSHKVSTARATIDHASGRLLAQAALSTRDPTNIHRQQVDAHAMLPPVAIESDQT